MLKTTQVLRPLYICSVDMTVSFKFTVKWILKSCISICKDEGNRSTELIYDLYNKTF